MGRTHGAEEAFYTMQIDPSSYTEATTLADTDKLIVKQSSGWRSLTALTLFNWLSGLFAPARTADENYVTDTEKDDLHAAVTPGAGITVNGQEVTNSDRGSVAVTGHLNAIDHAGLSPLAGPGSAQAFSAGVLTATSSTLSEYIPRTVPMSNVLTGVTEYTDTSMEAKSALFKNSIPATITSGTKTQVSQLSVSQVVASGTAAVISIGVKMVALAEALSNTANNIVYGAYALHFRNAPTDTSNSATNSSYGFYSVNGHGPFLPTTASSVTVVGSNVGVHNQSGIISTARGSSTLLRLGNDSNSKANTTTLAVGHISRLSTGHASNGVLTNIGNYTHHDSTTSIANGTRITDFYGFRLQAPTVAGDAAISGIRRGISIEDPFCENYLYSGVKFANVANASPTVLDWYEEGSWTPTLTCSTPNDLSVTYTIQAGRFTRIGNRITVDFSVAGTLAYTTATGSLRISMPTLSTSDVGLTSGHSTITALQGFTRAGYSSLQTYVAASTQYATLQWAGIEQNFAVSSITDYTPEATFRFNGTLSYIV